MYDVNIIRLFSHLDHMTSQYFWVVLKYEMGNFGEMGQNGQSLGEMGINNRG